ncbi:MAG TPA: late competence development ComFB family protein [Gemmatimonadaceae bacterium]|nr:late competence development ComFB family protein [Gemmatimonadaceae bacterium]
MKNILETTVRQIHADLCTRNASFCACLQCADDVAAMVMNKSRPRYTTTKLGWAVENVDLVSDQTRTELSVLILDAMRRVAERPRHAPRAASGSGRPGV